MQRTFITERGTRGTAYEGYAETAGMPNSVVRSLEDRHLLNAEHRSGLRWYELPHDRLIEPLRASDAADHVAAAREAVTNGDLDYAEWNAEHVILFPAGDQRSVASANEVLGDVAQRRGNLMAAHDRYRNAADLSEVAGRSGDAGRALGLAGRVSVLIADDLQQQNAAEEEIVVWRAKAVVELQAAAKLAPADSQVWLGLGLAFWHSGQPHQAVLALSRSVQIDEAIEAIRWRGEILADLQLDQRAMDDLNKVRLHESVATVAARALALTLSGHDATSEIGVVVANGQENGPALLRLARVRQLREDVNAVLDLLVKALEARRPPLPSHLRSMAENMIGDLVRRSSA
jgi:tetratricopeptide (TPR) repeat protein